MPIRFAAFMEGNPCLSYMKCTCRIEESPPNAAVSKWIWSCAGVSDFDAGLFRLPSAEAAAIDAQQRLLLEVGHEVFAAAAPPGSKAKVQSLSPTCISLYLQPIPVYTVSA